MKRLFVLTEMLRSGKPYGENCTEVYLASDVDRLRAEGRERVRVLRAVFKLTDEQFSLLEYPIDGPCRENISFGESVLDKLSAFFEEGHDDSK